MSKIIYLEVPFSVVGGVHGFEIPELVRIVTPRSRSDRGVTARVKVF